MYDKVDDLAKTKNRAVEKGHQKDHNFQYQMFDDIRKKEKRPVEILRIEMRFLHKSRMRKIFNDLGLPNIFTFRSLFREKVWKSLVLDYWRKLSTAL